MLAGSDIWCALSRSTFRDVSQPPPAVQFVGFSSNDRRVNAFRVLEKRRDAKLRLPPVVASPSMEPTALRSRSTFGEAMTRHNSLQQLERTVSLHSLSGSGSPAPLPRKHSTVGESPLRRRRSSKWGRYDNPILSTDLSQHAYERVMRCFNVIDLSRKGVLGFEEVQELARAALPPGEGAVDVHDFLRVDCGNCTANFAGVLKCLYPSLTLEEIDNAIELWGQPPQCTGPNKRTLWRQCHLRDPVMEITSSPQLAQLAKFSYRRLRDKSGGSTVTAQALAEDVPGSLCTREDAEDMVYEYDSSGKGGLTEADFARMIMSYHSFTSKVT